MRRTVARIVELRLGWRLVGKDLRLDIEVVTTHRGERGAQSVMLAHGRSAWSSPRSELENEVLSWLQGRQSADWPHDPAGLPDQQLARVWGDLLARMLAAAADQSVLELEFFGPARVPATLGRIASLAHDAATAALPIETLVWPPNTESTVVAGGSDRALSIVRVPVRAQARGPADVGLHEPGRFRVRVATAPGPKHEFGLGEMAALVRGSASSQTRVEEVAEVTSTTLTQAAAGSAADLLVLCGHGRGHEGLRVAGPDGPQQIGGEQLAQEAVGPATVAVLAMCGSALGGPTSERVGLRSPAETVAEHGTEIAIGFHGNRANLAVVRTFASRLVEEIGHGLAAEDSRADLDLVDWELAIIEARPLQTATAPAVWVAPALLAGRSPGQRIARRLSTDDVVKATAFYVPGQIACVRDGMSTLRFPLVVDVGIDLEVRVTKDVRTSAGNTALKLDLVQRCADAFGITGGHGLVLERSGEPPRWAAAPSELSALIRALCTLLECPVPDAAQRELDRLVAGHWGAHDGAPRVIDAVTGERRGHFDSWPPITVRALGDRPPTSSSLLEAVAKEPPAFGSQDLRDPGVLDCSDIAALVRRQADAVRGWCGRQRSGTNAVHVALKRSGAIVVVPDAAKVVPGTGAVPRLQGVNARVVGAPDVLAD